MAYNGPYIAKIKKEGDCFYISRGTKRIKLTPGYNFLAFDALVSAKETHEGDSLLEHWIDGQWQKKSK